MKISALIALAALVALLFPAFAWADEGGSAKPLLSEKELEKHLQEIDRFVREVEKLTGKEFETLSPDLTHMILNYNWAIGSTGMNTADGGLGGDGGDSSASIAAPDAIAGAATASTDLDERAAPKSIVPHPSVPSSPFRLSDIWEFVKPALLPLAIAVLIALGFDFVRSRIRPRPHRS